MTVIMDWREKLDLDYRVKRFSDRAYHNLPTPQFSAYCEWVLSFGWVRGPDGNRPRWKVEAQLAHRD